MSGRLSLIFVLFFSPQTRSPVNILLKLNLSSSLLFFFGLWLAYHEYIFWVGKRENTMRMSNVNSCPHKKTYRGEHFNQHRGFRLPSFLDEVLRQGITERRLTCGRSSTILALTFGKELLFVCTEVTGSGWHDESAGEGVRMDGMG